MPRNVPRGNKLTLNMQASTYRSLALIVAASLAILCGYEVATENFLTDKSMIRNLAQKHWWKQKQHWKRTHEMFEAHLAAENALLPSKQLSKSERIAKFAQFKAMKRDKTRVSSLQASPSPEPTVSSLQASPSPEPTVSSPQASPSPEPTVSSLQASPSPEPTVSSLKAKASPSPAPREAIDAFDMFENTGSARKVTRQRIA